LTLEPPGPTFLKTGSMGDRLWEGRKSKRKYWQYLNERNWSKWHLFDGPGFPSPKAYTLCGLKLPLTIEGIRSRITTPTEDLCVKCDAAEHREAEGNDS
jgi:hypothetical protein